jgi:VWFA-related protein
LRALVKKSTLSATLGLLLILVSARSVSVQQATPQFRTRLDLIQVDASVVDKTHQPVRGLTAADFTILENGKPQNIQTFVPVNLAEEPPSPPSWMRDVAPDVISNTGVEDERLVVIVMDDYSDDVSKDLFAMRSSKEIGRGVVERLGPHDLAAVVFTVGSEHNQEFTHDRQRLLAAVDQFNPAKYLPQFSTFGVLERVCEVLGSVQQRRKAVIWISPGVAPPGTNLGAVINIAQAGNVNIYPIDPAGIRVGSVSPPSASGGLGATAVGAASTPVTVPTPKDDMERMNDIDRLNSLRANMFALASFTGGHSFQWNEFQKSLNQVFRETGAFYLLGYVSSIPVVDGKPRRLEVKVNRKGVIVSSRSGYFPTVQSEAAPLPPPPSQAALEALSGLVPTRGVPLQIAAVPFATGGMPAVAVTLGLPAPADGADDFDVLIKAFTFDGNLMQTRSVRAHVAARAPAAGSDNTVQLSDRLDLAPGRYQLRAAVTSALHQTSGSVYADLDVPDFSAVPLALSGVALDESGAVRVTPTESARLISAVGSGLPFPVAPVTTRNFPSSARVTSFLEIYQGPKPTPQPVLMTVSIRDGGDRVVFTQTDAMEIGRFDASHRAQYRFVLPLATIPPGEYLLTFDAKASPVTAHRDVRFTVR